MIKMFINDEEVVSNKELTIKEEMLATPSTILNNCYPKAWENVKDYVSKFYYPKDYSRCIIAKGFERGEDRWLIYNESGSNINFDTNISLPFKNITIDGKSTQATSTQSANLFDEDYYRNATYTNNVYRYTLSKIKGGRRLYVKAKLKEGKSAVSGIYVCLSTNPNPNTLGSKYQWFINNGNTPNASFNPETFTDYLYFSFYPTTTTLSQIFDNYNLWVSTDNINYEPFVPDMPSPDYPSEIECVGTYNEETGKYTIQVKDVGKNLFNYDEYKKNVSYLTLIENGFKTNKYSCWLNKNIDFLEKGETYALSYDVKKYGLQQNTNASGTIAIRDITKNKFIGFYHSGSTFTIPEDAGALIFYFFGANPANDDNYYEFKNIQIEKGTQATTYEPYQENTLNINLQGNELCSLPNNVKDELIIENGRAKIIKNVGKYNITGNESWALSGTERQPYINFSNYADNCKYPATTTELPNLLSNYYLQITRNNLYDGRITLSPSKALIIYDTVHNTSLANFKEWLKSAGVVVYYQLATPIEIDLGEVTTLSTFEGVNNVSLVANMQTNMSLTYLYKNYELIFCGIVKNSGNISLNPRYPHFCDLQILDFKNFLSESDMLDFVISNKTVVEAINMVIEAIKDYGFVLGNVNIFGADDIIKAYSTQNKTAYDVFQYLADITGSRWYTRTIDEETVAIDFYDPTLMPSGMNIEYNVDWFEENQIVDLQFNYGSRDYRNKQVMMSNEVFGNINYNETLISNGYETSYLLLNNIGEIVSITINGEEKTFVTNELHDIGFEADFYYTPNKNQLESEDTYPIGTQIVVKYIPIIEGRQVVYNYDEIMRINNQTGRKGIIARYETRNDTTSSKELEKIGETYIKYKGTSEINLLLTSEKDLYNIGQIVYFDSPINELTQSYMVKTKEIKIIAVADFQKVFYDYELTSSFNSEKEINYFDNQRSKNKGNIEDGETITRNIDIENSTEILFNNLSLSEVAPTGDNILDCILESPFIN